MIIRLYSLIVVIQFISCGAGIQSPPKLDGETKRALHACLDSQRRTPQEYVVEKFRDHDVVILGEYHRIRENVLLVHELIPLLHRSGIRVLATEFARREDQRLIDSLLAGGDYDEPLAREITFRQLMSWGFQEYVDIFRAAWELNHSLPDSVPHFRIIGMNDSPDWSVVKTQEDREKDEIKRQVWRGGGEHLWAKSVTDVVSTGEKALVYCGIHHGFSRYNQPIVSEGKFIRFDTTRTGNYLRRALGDRVMTVFLHALWPPRSGYGSEHVYAADGQIDALFAELGAQYYPVGIDLTGAPFGNLTGAKSVYSQGYADFTIGQFADGWIFQCPLSQYHGVTPIADFITEQNVERAKRQSPNPALREMSVAELNEMIVRDAGQSWWIGKYK